MEDKHRAIINRNIISLIEQSNLEILIPRLIEKNVLTATMAEPFQNNLLPLRERKQNLFFRIQSRGPEAFKNLIAALTETGHFGLVGLLSGYDDGDENSAISLKEANNLLQGANGNRAKGIQIFKNSIASSNNSDSDSENNVFGNEGTNIDLGIEPLIINVQKATRFYDKEGGKVPLYPMRSSKRGVYLIINIIDFVNETQDTRKGAHIDQENLEELFKQMGFVGESHVNLTSSQIRDVIEDFSHSDLLNKTDCAVITIMSHGNEKNGCSYMYTQDNRTIMLSSIINSFNNVECEKLRNRPKIFLFQCCRGSHGDSGIYSDMSEAPKSSIQKDSGGGKDVRLTAGSPTYSDMLICNATVPGFACYRDKLTGAFFIHEVCKVWAKHAHDTHVVDMMMIVDNILRQVITGDNKRQTPCFENRSFNHCYFNPGLYE